ncbi:hypothetical protein [Flavobacterium sp.]|jgi:hypothetical protein|uniref:hypothetical protein n=1 Tax=Flavobacterium sp. TaxID=239 RepID=UPI0037BFFF33
MTTAALKHVNNKLKNLPDALVEEVEKYIDFLAFKHSQENQQIPQWQQDLVIKRINENQMPVDAFDMIDDLDS